LKEFEGCEYKQIKLKKPKSVSYEETFKEKLNNR
jgi:hypothetical protein